MESWFILWRFFFWSCFYLHKSTIQWCMEYCCHSWAGAPSCYLELFDKLQKLICRTVSPSLDVSLKPFLAHCWTGWNGYFLILKGGLIVIMLDCMLFQSQFLDVTRISMSIVSFFIPLDYAGAAIQWYLPNHWSSLNFPIMSKLTFFETKESAGITCLG